MRRQSIVLLAGTLALLAVGCTTGSEEGTDVSSSPSPQAEGSPVAAQPFENPMEQQKAGDKKDGKAAKTNAKKTNKIAGLLESTDPEERAKQVQSGIRSRSGLDPFAALPTLTEFKLPEDPNSVAFSGGSGGGFRGGSNSFGGRGSRAPLGSLTAGGGGFSNNSFGRGGPSPLVSGGRSGGGGSSVASLPNIPSFQPVPEIRYPKPPTIASTGGTSTGLNAPNNGLKPLPELPEPKLAQAVEVTGVVTIGGLTKAIIKAPNEPTGRHVEVGQRLSNGQVLVKRIESNAGTDPIVIFEENGQEVARGVGEKATPADGSSPTV
jgi:hypothetical protein